MLIPKKMTTKAWIRYILWALILYLFVKNTILNELYQNIGMFIGAFLVYIVLFLIATALTQEKNKKKK